MADYRYGSSDSSGRSGSSNGEQDPERLLSSPAHKLGQWADRAWRVATLPLLLFLFVPIVALFLHLSPGELFATMVTPDVTQAVWVSLRTTLISAAIILVAGTPVAYLLAGRKFPLRRVVDTLIDLPTVLPPSVAGLALLMTLGRRGLLGGVLQAAGITIAFTPAAVVMAQIFVAAPYYVRAAMVGFSNVDHDLIQAAQLDGASSWQAFRYITLPISRFSVITGGIMSWSRALGEFGATILFAGNFVGRTQTMPMAIYLGFQSNLDVALSLSVILVVISFIALLVVKWVVDANPD